jgi:hypothetical protein
MAAEQIPGRTCACLCGRSLDGYGPKTLFAPECIKKRKAARKAASYIEEKTRREKKIRERRDYSAPHRFACASWRKTANDAPYVPSMKCHVCMDMSWCRRPDRAQEGRDGYAPSGKMVGVESLTGWRCSGCGEPYAPEPKPEFGSLLRSSAGTAAKASELWGYQPAMGGQKTGEQLVAVRAAKKAKGQNDGG